MRLLHNSAIGGNPFLSAIECSRILRKYQKSFIPPPALLSKKTLTLIKRIDSSTLGSNSPNEDQSFLHHINTLDNSLVMGVLDGHWTGDCAALVKKSLPSILKKLSEKKESHLLDTDDFIHAFDWLDRAICSLPWKTLESMGKSTQDLKSLSLSERKQILDSSISAFSGSCALVAHLRGNQVQIAHSGDSRAVLGSYDTAKKLWGVRTLTEDHQASNLRELARLHSNHPGEDDTVASASDGPLRVLGGLMPSRAFGDARYKWSLKEQSQMDMLLKGVPINSYAWLRPQNLLTPPYITSTPEVCKFTIRPSHDRFLVLATDGIFDVLTSRDITRIISNYLREKNLQTIGEEENAATYLIRHAVEMGNGHEFLSRMLSLEPKVSRRYRDDMTVQVVFFSDDIPTTAAYIQNTLDPLQ